MYSPASSSVTTCDHRAAVWARRTCGTISLQAQPAGRRATTPDSWWLWSQHDKMIHICVSVGKPDPPCIALSWNLSLCIACGLVVLRADLLSEQIIARR